MSLLLRRARVLPRTEAEDFFREQGMRSPVGPLLFSVALLNLASAIFSLAAQ
jgi:hypothetical protein